MKAFLIITFALGLFVVAAVIFTSHPAVGNTTALTYHTPFKLGDPRTSALWCQEHNSDEVVECYLVGNYNISVGWYRRTNRIVSVTNFIYSEGRTAGEFILQWGTPRGIMRQRWGTYVFWPDNRMVFFLHVAGRFRPSSRAGFVSLDETAQPSCAWTGFTNRKGC